MMMSKRRDCRLMKCTTVLHGDVCHRISTPYKSENEMNKANLADRLITSLRLCRPKHCSFM